MFGFLPVTFYVEAGATRIPSSLRNFLDVYQVLEKNRTAMANFHRNHPKAEFRTDSVGESAGNKLWPISPISGNPLRHAKYSMPACHFVGHNLWLLKPSGLNRGRGIHVFHDLDTLKNLILDYYSNGSAAGTAKGAQMYDRDNDRVRVGGTDGSQSSAATASLCRNT